MPKLLGDIMSGLFAKAGINVDDGPGKDLLSNSAMLLEIPDDVNKNLETNIIGINDARNNHPALRKHYYQKALMGVDKFVASQLDELPEELQKQILDEENTFTKLNLYIDGIKEAEGKKAGAGKIDKTELQKTTAELHKQLAEEKKAKEELKKSFDNDLLKYRVQSQIESMVSRYKTTFDELDPSVKLTTIKSLLDKELQDKDADLTFDEKGTLALLKKDGSNYYGDNHQQVNPQSFLESLLSRNKLLITTPKQGITPTPSQPASGGGGGKDNQSTGQSTMKELLKQSQAAINGQVAVV